MTAARRWWCVGIGVLLILATPVLVGALPANDEDISATALLARIEKSSGVAFSGYVETEATIALPENDALSSLDSVLGDSSRLRVWWQDPDRWRVATLRTTGETDLLHAKGRTLRWVYESRNVTLTPDVAVRLPNSSDLVPNVLARRMLSGARPDELSRLPATRIAGRDALGLRLTPAEAVSSIAHVDLWADAETGLPLRVEMFGRGEPVPALATSFRDLTLSAPAPGDLEFAFPEDADLRYDDTIDLAATVDRFADGVPPRSLAGLTATGRRLGAVGVYGRGPTVLLAIPVSHRAAHELRDQVTGQPGAQPLDGAVVVASGPLQLMVTDFGNDGGAWLLAGTVTREALVSADMRLNAGPRVVR